MSKSSRGAFTLVELMVVVGIISLLVALLMPALTAARVAAKRVYCAAQMRTLGQGFLQYQNEYRGAFPPAIAIWSQSAAMGWQARPWSSFIYRYISNGDIPEDTLWNQNAVNTNHVITPTTSQIVQGGQLFHCPDDESPVGTATIRLSYQLNCSVSRGWVGLKWYWQMDGIGYTGNSWTGNFGYGFPLAYLWDRNDPSLSAAQAAEAQWPYTRASWLSNASETILLSEFWRPYSQNASNWVDGHGLNCATSGYDSQAPGASPAIWDVVTLHNNIGNFLFCDGHVSAMDPVATVGNDCAPYFPVTNDYQLINIHTYRALDRGGNAQIPLGMWVKNK